MRLISFTPHSFHTPPLPVDCQQCQTVVARYVPKLNWIPPYSFHLNTTPHIPPNSPKYGPSPIPVCCQPWWERDRAQSIPLVYHIPIPQNSPKHPPKHLKTPPNSRPIPVCCQLWWERGQAQRRPKAFEQAPSWTLLHPDDQQDDDGGGDGGDDYVELCSIRALVRLVF